jgi:hypothetical protein
LCTWRTNQVITEFSEHLGGKHLIRKAHVEGWNEDCPVINERGFVIFLQRDPRDVTISQMYYRRLKPTDDNITLTIWSNRRPAPDRAPEEFKDMNIYEAWVRSYTRHPDRYDLEVRYERLKEREVEELQRILIAIRGKPLHPNIARAKWARHSFANVKRWGPSAHTQHSMRKGISGDWRNHFKRHHGKLFAEGFNDLMLELGYIDDPDWWKALPE